MSQAPHNIEELWALSELEQRVETKPNPIDMETLAGRYAALGWADEARKMRQRAETCPMPVESPAPVKPAEAPEPPSSVTTSQAPSAPAPAPPAPVEGPRILRGRFTPPVLIQLLRVLHLTEQSGELVLEAAGGIVVSVTFEQGQLATAHATGGEEGETAVHQALRLKGGRYQFLAKPVSATNPNLPPDTAGLIAVFAAEVATP